jgi:hypothetical protein
MKRLDGCYYIAPEGSAWEYIEVVEGMIVSSTSEADLDTHRSAGDDFATLDPSTSRPVYDRRLARRIIRLWRPDANPDVCIVARA